jgi:hypothetical protein
LSSPADEIRRILDQPNLELTKAMRVLDADLQPNPDGSIVFSARTFDALDTVRSRYGVTRKRLAAVEHGGRAARQLIDAFDELDGATSDFAKAARIGYSREQITAFDAASKRMDAGTSKLKLVRRKLPG